MNTSFQLMHQRVFALLLVAVIGGLSGCATAMRPVGVSVEHPANPHAATGTSALTEFPLLAPGAQKADSNASPADTDEKMPAPAHHHSS
jgi:hypothetical protein